MQVFLFDFICFHLVHVYVDLAMVLLEQWEKDLGRTRVGTRVEGGVLQTYESKRL